jgi:hypothetical protein
MTHRHATASARAGRLLGPALAALALLPAPSARAEEKKPPEVDQARIDDAIAKGAEWLRSRLKCGLPEINEAASGLHAGQTYNEIVLYALIHAGVNRGDPDLIKLVHEIRKDVPRHTYTGAMRAMALELFDPEKLKHDLVQCTEFLINNQGKNGQWGYSHRLPLSGIPTVVFTPSKAPPRYVFSGPGGGPAEEAEGAAGAGAAAAPGAAPAGAVAPARNETTVKGAGGGAVTKPKATKRVIPRRDFGTYNDNSNSQYALLGLSACMAGGIFPAPDCLQLAETWWTNCQNEDGGWDYAGKGAKEGTSYGSMTAGGVSSLSVCLRGDGKNRDPLEDERVKKGLAWLAANLNFGSNPLATGHIARAAWSNYYWVYAVERAGSLAGTEWFGDRPWYSTGAAYLLSCQSPEGTWGNGTNDGQKILDTCWAILFLRRATKQIQKKIVVYTHDSHKEK